MINKVTLIGNLGRDPEVRTTGAGMAIGNLRLATTERVKDREGNWTDHTEWHTVVCFGRTAENVAKYLTKGRQVYIEGKLRTREWQDKEGAKRISTEIVADDVRFIGGREGGAGGGGGHREPSSPAAGGGGGWDVGGGSSGGSDEDIPF